MKKEIYEEVNENFAKITHINHDCVILHDPQPMPMVKFYRKRQTWIWRCHVDLSHPYLPLWEYFKTFLLRYDLVIVSDEKYVKEDLPVPQRIIRPAIDPLSPKNKPLDKKTIDEYLAKYNIPTDKPIILQVSRFDKWKDPEGVIDVFSLVKEEIDCTLVLLGNKATDDPEGEIIFEQVRKKAKKYKDVILLTVDNNILVNVLQTRADVVLQKSLREGFGLTVTEALWKERPVVASNVGGIPLQVIDGETGFLVEPTDIKGCAEKVIRILKDKELAEYFGKNGKEHVRKNFLITRKFINYLDLLIEILA